MTKKVEIIDKEEFMVAALNVDNETFVLHIAALAKPTIIPIYLSCQVSVALLTSKEIGIPTKFSNFFKVFSSDSVAKLPEYTEFDDHPIDLLDNKQPPYSPIYSLGPVKLETFKTFIKANFASSFIRPSKSSAITIILFV